MHHDADISILSEEVASLRALVQEQAAELAALRQTTGPDTPVSRRHLIRGLAGLGAAGVAGMVATAEPAAAADGDPLVLGQANTSSSPTNLVYTDGATGHTAEARLGDPWSGVAGIASNGAGVIGYIADAGYAGLHGQVDQPMGVGVLAEAQQAGSIALGAQSVSGPTVWAKSDDGVTLRLEPASRGGPPTTVPSGLPFYETGAFSVDNTGEVWLCVESGSPGTWTRLLREDTAPGRVIPITPFRALDTRAAGGRAAGAPVIPGQLQGPLTNGQIVILDLAGVAPIPTTATGVVGTITVANNTSAGRLQVLPAGTTPPTATSTLNFTANVHQSSFTSGLSATGLSTIATLLSAGGTYHLILDITAYIT